MHSQSDGEEVKKERTERACASFAGRRVFWKSVREEEKKKKKYIHFIYHH